MTSTILRTAALFYTATLAQTDELSPMDLLVAATSAEQTIDHGEIVFHCKSGSPEDLSLMLAPEGDVDVQELELIFNFRDMSHFRITIRGGGVTRTMVSDGEFIDMGNGEIWDYRFFSEEWASAINADDEQFYDLFWPYYAVIEPHLFPLSARAESEYFNEDDGKAEFETASEGAPDTRTIRFTMFEEDFDDEFAIWERFVVLTGPGVRLAEWTGYYDGEAYEHEEWSEPFELEDGRVVMGSYRHSQPDSDEDATSLSTIDFGASNFDHLPHESEFVIDRDAFDRVVKWREPNPIAEEIEYYLYMWFDWDVDVEPLVARTLKTSLVIVVVLAALLLAFEARRHWRRRRKQD